MRVQIVRIMLLFLLAPLIVRAESKPLPETYVSDDEVTTFRYPTGWTIDAEQPGLVLVGTSDDPFTINSMSVAPGEAAVVVIFSNADDAYLRAYFQGNDTTALLNHFIETVFTPVINESTKFSAPQPVKFADFPAVRSDGTFANSAIFLIVADRGSGVYSLMVGLTAASERSKYEPKLLAIAESVNYQPRSQ